MAAVPDVLVISPEAEHFKSINAAAQSHQLRAFRCAQLADANEILARQHVGVIFCQDVLPDGNFRSAIENAQSTPVIVMSRFAEWENCINALHAGAFDYVATPLDSAELDRILRAAVENSSPERANAAVCAAGS
ncbi:MAG TPA: response regulator [Candidatus Acidoferrales bacterium]|nr:response regulator [Candidatus Acidoferrales bacterium]